jgi:hypothetical protein
VPVAHSDTFTSVRALADEHAVLRQGLFTTPGLLRASKSLRRYGAGFILWLPLLTGCGTATTAQLAPVATPISPPPTNPAQGPTSLTTATVACQLPRVGDTNTLGTILLNTNSSQTVILHPAVAASGASLVVLSSAWNNTGDIMLLHYQYGSQTMNLTASCRNESDGMAITVDADEAGIVGFDFGAWSAALSVSPITVPYYTSDIAYSTGAGAFLNVWWDYTATHASRLTQSAVIYDPLTSGVLNIAHEVLKVRASATLGAVLPPVSNKPSPYMARLAGKTIINILDPSFATTLTGLQQLSGYVNGNCAVIIHNWQHFGYDNGLPQHLSANLALGGDDGVSAVTRQAAADGCLVAVHENYIDYYPNYPAYDANSLAASSSNEPLLGWLNVATGIQAYQTKPLQMNTLAATQSPGIHGRYGTTATYIDVNSAVGVDWKQDMDSRQPQAGQIGLWLTAASSLWSFEQRTHQGPVFGEGLNHWYYSGLLDGVEAQLGAGKTAANIGEDLPLFVDFDLDIIHPLQVNHGMGLYERWSKSQSPYLSLFEHDAYRTQEIAFGHAPFVDRGEWANVFGTMQECDLVGPVAAAYGKSLVTAITYRINGSFVDSSHAARVAAKYPAAAGSATGGIFAQVQVDYANGLSTFANAGDTYTWNGIVIPQYGWAATGDGITAFTAQCGSTLCDFASTASTLFANARSQIDYRNAWHFARPSVQMLTFQGLSQASLSLNWQVLSGPAGSASYLAFVHFVDDALVSATDEGIVFQADHDLATPTGTWTPGQTVVDGSNPVYIPPALPDGMYSVRVGLYDPLTVFRADLAGDVDATGRIIVGHISVHGDQISFIPEPAASDDPRLNSQETIVDFGSVKTDGMVQMQYASGKWTLTPMPPSRNFSVFLRKLEYPMPTTFVQPASGAGTIPVDLGDFWQLPLTAAKSYSWAASCPTCQSSAR